MEGVTLSEVVLDVEKSAVIIKDLRIEDPTVYNYLVELDHPNCYSAFRLFVHILYGPCQTQERDSELQGIPHVIIRK